MKLTDWIGLISFFGVAAYSITALAMLIRNSRRSSAHPGERGGTSKPIDLESAALWHPLAAAEEKQCCIAVKKVAAQWEHPYLEISWDKKVMRKVWITYCPECGRKL